MLRGVVLGLCLVLATEPAFAAFNGVGLFQVKADANDGAGGAIDGNAQVLFTPQLGTVNGITHTVGIFVRPQITSLTDNTAYPAAYNMKWGDTGSPVPAGTKGKLVGYEANITTAQTPGDEDFADEHMFGGTMIFKGGAGGAGMTMVVNSDTTAPGASIWGYELGMSCAVNTDNACLNQKGMELANQGTNMLGTGLKISGPWQLEVADQSPTGTGETASLKGFSLFGDGTHANPDVLVGNTGNGFGTVGTTSNHSLRFRVANADQLQLGNNGIVEYLNASAFTDTTHCGSLSGSSKCVIIVDSDGAARYVPVY